jgi:hypothetical protein
LDEVSVKYLRPQILTGVDLVPTRSDILERCLIVRLERIPEKNRLSERKLESLISSLLPGIYGSLLDLMATALRNLPTIELDELPRMGDFYELCIAAGIPDFVETYSSNIEIGNQAAVEANPIADGIVCLLDAHKGSWHGTATELIRGLQELDPTNKLFQKLSASSIGKKLGSSLKTDLEAVGVKVDHGRTGSQRYLTLRRVEPQKTMPQSPPVSTPSLDKEEKQSPPPMPQNTPARNNGATAAPSAPAKPEVEEDSHTSRWQWNSLLDAYDRAGVPHWRFRDVVSEAAGISKKDVGNISLSQEQYQRAMAYLANYQNGATASAPARPEEKKTPVAVSSPPTTSTQTGLPVSPSDNGNGHSSYSSDSAEIGLPLAHEGIPPWLWEG